MLNSYQLNYGYQKLPKPLQEQMMYRYVKSSFDIPYEINEYEEIDPYSKEYDRAWAYETDEGFNIEIDQLPGMTYDITITDQDHRIMKSGCRSGVKSLEEALRRVSTWMKLQQSVLNK